MKKLPLTKFDLAFVIAAVVVALLGAGVWWYLSGEIQTVQQDVSDAKTDFDKYSTKSDIVVTKTNGKLLQANIDLMTAQLAPLIQSTLQPKANKLASIDKEDPVAWKHDLDDEVHRLTDSAKLRSVAIPANFYFGFSRYLNQSPRDEQTPVLSKQLLGIEQITSVLINAPVKAITVIRRSYEEDPRPSAGSFSSGAPSESDHFGGYSVNAPANDYTSYPFEVEFDTTPENLRNVIDNLLQPPYVFVVRSLTVKNTAPNSPLISSLDALAGTPASSVTDSTPGEVAATTSTKGPQFLFGSSLLHVKARIDMIEWKAGTLRPTQGGASRNPSSPGGA